MNVKRIDRFSGREEIVTVQEAAQRIANCGAYRTGEETVAAVESDLREGYDFATPGFVYKPVCEMPTT